jgi:hypothetical protein
MLQKGHSILSIHLTGLLGNATEGNFDVAAAAIVAGLEAWQPWAAILDLRKVTYTWGDKMENVVTAPERWGKNIHPLRSVLSGGTADEPFPVAIVASESCRAGLESLLREQMNRDPSSILFDSIAAATSALEAQLRGEPLL